MFSVFPVYAPSDRAFAEQLDRFLQADSRAACDLADGEIAADEDLLDKAEEGLGSDIVLLLLSPASTLPQWRPRERWEHLLLHQTRESKTALGIILIEPCRFPELLRKSRPFFDATADPKLAMRCAKRWIVNATLPSELFSRNDFSRDLETLHCLVSDQPGDATASGATAERFAREAEPDFEKILWIPAHRRSLTSCTGTIAQKLNISAAEPPAQNLETIQSALQNRRYLLVLDDPPNAVQAAFHHLGQTSTLVTTDPVRIPHDPITYESARALVKQRRLAEAYETFQLLLEQDSQPDACTHELIAICETWDWQTEAAKLRRQLKTGSWRQLSLFNQLQLNLTS